MIPGIYRTADTIKNFCYAKYTAFNSKLAEIINTKAMEIIFEVIYIVPCVVLHYNVCVLVGFPLGYFMHKQVKEVEEDMIALVNKTNPYFGKITLVIVSYIIAKFVPQLMLLTSIYCSARLGAKLKTMAENEKRKMIPLNVSN